MKKLFGFILVLIFVVVLVVCGNGSKSGSDDKKIIVGVLLVLYVEILEKVKLLLEKKGYELDIKIINDYIMFNKLLDKGEIDVNYF